MTNFNSCFQGCTSLQSIPSGLFDSNTAVTNFQYCFYGCSSLTDFTLYIGSSSVTSCSSFVSKKSGTTRIVYVPDSSTTYTKFTAVASTLGLTVNPITYTIIEVSSPSYEKEYDGEPISISDRGTPSISSGELAQGDSISFTLTGNIPALIGSYNNTFDYTLTNNSGAYYIVQKTYGTLVITDDCFSNGSEILESMLTMTVENDEYEYKLGDTVTFNIEAFNPYNYALTINLIEIEDVTLAQSTFEDVHAGATITTSATYTVSESDIINEGFTNTLTASYGINKTITAVCSILTEEPNPSLSVAMATVSTPANEESYALGETIYYEIVVTNDGNLTLTDIVVSSERTGDEWTIDELPPGASSITLEASSTVSEEDILEGEVIADITASTISPVDGEDYMATDENSEPTEDPNPLLSVTVSETSTPANGVAYAPGETIRYTIEYQNVGNLTLTSVDVYDELSAHGQTPYSLFPGESYSFTAECHPSSAGTYSTSLVCSADNPSEEETSFVLNDISFTVA